MKSSKILTRISLTPEHHKWLIGMELTGVDRNSLIAMALNILIPRTGNIKSTDCLIRSVACNQRMAENKLTSKEMDY